MIKDHITHEGLDIMDKRLASGQHLAQQRLRVIAPLQYRMAQKGQQVEAEQKRCQILLAMTKVVLQMRALGLEHVGVFVCNLPAPTPRVRNVHNVVSRQGMIGHTAIVIQLLARCGVDDGEVEPIDRPGIVTASQEHVVEVAHQRHCRETPMPGVPFTLGSRVVGLPKRQALRERGMGVGFARQDAVATMLEHQCTKGLVASTAWLR